MQSIVLKENNRLNINVLTMADLSVSLLFLPNLLVEALIFCVNLEKNWNLPPIKGEVLLELESE